MCRRSLRLVEIAIVKELKMSHGIENVTDEIKGKGTERARYREEVAVRTCAEIAALAGVLADLAGGASCRTEATAQ